MPVAIDLAGSIGLAVVIAFALVSCGETSAQHPSRLRTATSPTAAVSYPPADRRLLDILAVLRRPQSRADLDPAVLAKARAWSRSPTIRTLVGMPVISLIRLASITPWRQKVFLIPTRPLTRKEIARLPAKDRARARAENRAFPGLRLSMPAVGGAPVGQIEAGLDLGTQRSNQLVLIVPDGAAKVKIWFGLDRGPTHTHPIPVTANVRNNVAAFLLPRRIQAQPLREVWYGPSGTVIKRINATRCRHLLEGCA